MPLPMLAHNYSKGLSTSISLVYARGGCGAESSRCRSVLKSCKNGQRSLSHATSSARSNFPRSLKLRASPVCHIFQASELSTVWAAYMSSAGQSKYAAMRDESHPSLFYHLFDDDGIIEPVYSLSFLEERPASARSQTVLGWLPALSPAHAEGEESGLNDFVENGAFLSLLHETVKGGLLEDDIWTNGAIQAQSGWMHIFDQRNPPPLGRIPDPDDILASVRVEDGRMLINTYEPMPSYRICTGDGVCQLTDTLLDRLKLTLKRVAEDERENR